MNKKDRIPSWLDQLADDLAKAATLAARGRHAFDADDMIRLAFEALSNRAGEMAKRLTSADPERFADVVWKRAAQNRDFVVHHYDDLEEDLLWETIATHFPILATEVARQRGLDAPPGTV